MVDTFDASNNRIKITKGGITTFDTSFKSVQLFPDSTKLVLNRSIAFPNPIQTNAYHRYSGGIIGGLTYCESWSCLIWQEWGPNDVSHNEEYYSQNPGASIPGPTTRNLPQEFLGSVPADTDYLDVRVRLTRSHLPAVMWGNARPYVLFQEGQWVNLPGGSCPTEAYLPIFIRHFDIERVGTNVYLRRYQSVRNMGYRDRVMPSGGTIISTDSNVSGGWTVGNDGTGWTNMPARGSWLACRIDARGPDSIGGKRRFGTDTGTSNQCYIPGKTTSYPDLSAIYSGDIVIHPGRYQ